MEVYVLKESDFSTEQAIKKCLQKDVEIFRNEHGKPMISGNNDIHIGITHTNGLIFIGVWDKNFGIDAEFNNREVKNKDAIISKYFFESEKNKFFLDVWVKKEAYLKFLGTGLKDLKKADTSALKFQKIGYKDYIMYIYTEFPVEKITIKELF